MKKLFVLFFLSLGLFIGAEGQNMHDRATLHIKTSVRCAVDQKRIEDYFKREPGIQYLHVNYQNKMVTVRYTPSRTNPSNIRTAIANLGYDADTVKANPYYKKRLPPCPKLEARKARQKAMEEKRKAMEEKRKALREKQQALREKRRTEAAEKRAAMEARQKKAESH